MMFLSTQTLADEAIIIVHKSNPLSVIKKEDLSNIFLGKQVLWDSGGRIMAGMLSTDSPEVKAFLKSVCNKSVKRFNAHWMKFIFSGLGVKPQEFTNSRRAIFFISGNKNAIAIIDKSKLSGNVKRIKIVD